MTDTAKYDPTKKSLIDSLDDLSKEILENHRKFLIEEVNLKKAAMTEEEEADEIVRRLAAPPKPVISDFEKIVMPMIRRIIPGTIAHEIMGVQPMQESTGKIFTIRPEYKKDEDQ